MLGVYPQMRIRASCAPPAHRAIFEAELAALSEAHSKICWWGRMQSSLRVCGVATVATLASSFHVGAQSIDLPLQLVQSNAGVRLVANIGIGGAAPRPYLFDTGSALFNAGYSASAFGTVPASISGLPTGLSYSYGDGNTDTGNLVSTPSLQFYPTTSSASGVTLNALTPGGGASNFLLNAVYDRNGSPVGSSLPLETVPNGFQGIYGTFGAGNFAICRVQSNVNLACDNSTKNSVVLGGVLGQSTSGAGAGYVVAANGQPLSSLTTPTGATNPGASINGPQVGQSVTSCSPCVILGLTNALRAQFLPANRMAWTSTGNYAFPNSGTPGSTVFGINMSYQIGPNGQITLNQQPTLLDTGTQNFKFRNPNANATGLGAASGGVYTLSNGTVVSISGGAAGAAATTYQVASSASFPYPGVYATSVDTTGSLNQTIGVGFFLANSVMYDLAGNVTGYSPNFVTDVNIATTAASPLTIGSNSVPLGLAGVISGAGGVNITAGGSATLSATNTYTGPTNVSGGYLGLVGSEASIQSSSGVNLASGGLFDITGTTNGATIATLSDDGTGVVGLGNQVLTIQNGSTTFGGAFISSGGGLAINGGTQILTGANIGFGSAIVANGATLQFGAGGSISTITGNIANSGVVAFNLSGAYTFNGTISGSGAVSHSGTGVASLGGTHGYTGATSVTNGTLVVNGDISSSSSLTVSNGGTIAGNATLPTTTIGSGGAIAPGSSVGAHRVVGNFTLAPGGVYAVEIGSGVADKITVTGAASIGGTLRASVLGLSYSAKRHTIIDAAGGLTGTFAGLANGASLSLTGANAALVANPRILYSATTASIETGGVVSGALQTLLPANASPNQRAIARAIDAGASRSGASSAFDTFLNLSPSALPAALSQVSGEVAAGAPTSGFQASGAFLDALGGRVTSVGGGSPSPVTAYAPESKPTGAAAGIRTATGTSRNTVVPVWGVWASAFGGYSKISGNSGVGSSANVGHLAGVAVGVDYLVTPSARLGFSLGGSSSTWGLANAVGSGSADNLHVGLYGGADFGAAYVSSGLAYGRHQTSTSRTRYNGGFTGDSFGVRAETGYRLTVGDLAVTPFAAARLTHYWTPAYTETPATPGNPFALAFASQTSRSLRVEGGLMVERSIALADATTLVLRGRAAWAHDWNSSPSVTATFQTLPGSAFTVLGARAPRDLALVSAETEYRLNARTSLSAKLDGQFGAGATGFGATGTFRYQW